MTQLIINVEDPKLLAPLKKILNAMNGVSIVKTKRRRCGLDEALDDVRKGRVRIYKSAQDMYTVLGI